MKKIIIELDDEFADILTLTVIGTGIETNVSSCAFDIREKTNLKLNVIDGFPRWEQN